MITTSDQARFNTLRHRCCLVARGDKNSSGYPTASPLFNIDRFES